MRLLIGPSTGSQRTLFTLDWISDPALRRRSNAGLNKGRGAQRAGQGVFFHRLGEIRDHTFENQRYRASGLNLAVAAIILWNTVYLSRAVTELLSRGLRRQSDSGASTRVRLALWRHTSGARRLPGRIITFPVHTLK